MPGVEVWKVDGHSPGSQAIIVETSKGKVAIAGDLIYSFKNLEFDWPAGVIWNLSQWEKSVNMLKQNTDIVLPNHDYFLWELFSNGIIG